MIRPDPLHRRWTIIRRQELLDLQQQLDHANARIAALMASDRGHAAAAALSGARQAMGHCIGSEDE